MRYEHNTLWEIKKGLFIKRIHPQQLSDLTLHLYRELQARPQIKQLRTEHELRAIDHRTIKQTRMDFYPYLIETLFTNKQYQEGMLITRFSEQDFSLELSYKHKEPTRIRLSLHSRPKRTTQTTRQQVRQLYSPPDQEKIDEVIALINDAPRRYKTTLQ